MIIYKTTNLVNGKVYVGQDVHNNPDYLGSGILLIRAIKKYGRENFKKEAIDFAESIEVLNEKEIYWVKFCNCKAPNGYNLTEGGGGAIGYIWTDKQREKMKGELNPAKRPEVRQKISNKLIGRETPWQLRDLHAMHRPEVARRVSRKLKGRSKEYQKGENNPVKRLEVRQKISNKLIGRETPWLTGENNPAKRLEVREKISKAKTGKLRPDVSERNKILKRKVVTK